MVAPLSECEELTGRRRAICRGEANIPLDGPNGINAYRVHWGFDPLPVTANSNGAPAARITPTQNNRAVKAKKQKKAPRIGVGTELRKLFDGWKKFFGIEQEPELDVVTLDDVTGAVTASCFSCKGLEKLMNKWGPDWCATRIDDDPSNGDPSRHIGILSRIRSNAAKHTVPRLGITADKIPLFDFAVRRLIHRAIAQSRAMLKSPVVLENPPGE